MAIEGNSRQRGARHTCMTLVTDSGTGESSCAACGKVAQGARAEAPVMMYPVQQRLAELKAKSTSFTASFESKARRSFPEEEALAESLFVDVGRELRHLRKLVERAESGAPRQS